MPVNAINFVLTKTVLDRAVEASDKEPTEEQKKDISKASIVSALMPGNLGIFVPFIFRDSIVGDEDGGGDGDGNGDGDGDGDGDGGIEQRLDELDRSVDANKTQLEGINADLHSLNDKIDKLLAGNQETALSASAARKSTNVGQSS